MFTTRDALAAGAAGASLSEPWPASAPGTQVSFPGAESAQVAFRGFIYSLSAASYRRNPSDGCRTVLEIALPLG